MKREKETCCFAVECFCLERDCSENVLSCRPSWGFTINDGPFDSSCFIFFTDVEWNLVFVFFLSNREKRERERRCRQQQRGKQSRAPADSEEKISDIIEVAATQTCYTTEPVLLPLAQRCCTIFLVRQFLPFSYYLYCLFLVWPRQPHFRLLSISIHNQE